MKDGNGCFTNGFIKKARLNFSAIVNSVDCDKQAFADRLHSLAKYHAKNVHEWDEGKCFFHNLTVCDYGNCNKDDIKCEGKPYQTNTPFTLHCRTVLELVQLGLYRECEHN